MELTPFQENLAAADGRVFLSGPAGSGKTTAGVARLLHLLASGVPGDRILVLTPQRTISDPYFAALRDPGLAAGAQVPVLTVGGLARRLVDLFWPLAAEAAGFAHPDRPPVYLTLETSQYFMAHIVRPLMLEQGYFESITIDRNRLYAQIIDNLNKSAAVGFPHTSIGERLEAAWSGDPAHRRVYRDAQDCASRFRAFCLEHNLLDFSLQLQVFWEQLWPHPVVQEYLGRTVRHLIYDNLEEDAPRAHDIVRAWLPGLDSALLISDQGGGYRRFLGADPGSALALAELCDEQVAFAGSFVSSEAVQGLGAALSAAARGEPLPDVALDGALQFEMKTFYPEMLDWVAGEIRRLIDEDGLSPGQIAVLAPYLSDSLRFALMDRLSARGVPVRSHRPSRSLRDEPAARALLTLSALAHPGWGVHPPRADVTAALLQALDTDLVRAELLAQIVYRQKDLALTAFDAIKPEMQERLTFALGARYTQLADWLESYRAEAPLPLDHFLRRLFGEVLSQPGFGFHRAPDPSRVAASLIDSAAGFRQVFDLPDLPAFAEPVALGREYFDMLQEGVIAAQYLEGWRDPAEQAVLIAPAYTFLMMNRPAAVQFWLDPGASGWTERLNQPLTQPYVLSRGWESGRLWTDADEVASDREALARLCAGLLARCGDRLYLGLAGLGESGFEPRGALLRVFQKALQAGSAA